jgi:hypothetical protein
MKGNEVSQLSLRQVGDKPSVIAGAHRPNAVLSSAQTLWRWLVIVFHFLFTCLRRLRGIFSRSGTEGPQEIKLQQDGDPLQQVLMLDCTKSNLIAQTTSSTVYKAILRDHKGVKKDVAVKCWIVPKHNRDAIIAQLDREVKSRQTLSSPYIVNTFGRAVIPGQSADTYYLPMELCDRNLLQYVT